MCDYSYILMIVKFDFYMIIVFGVSVLKILMVIGLDGRWYK